MSNEEFECISDLVQEQLKKLQTIKKEIEKFESSNKFLRDKVKNLEREVYGPIYFNQISALAEENLRLYIDIHILSYQNDLLTGRDNKTAANIIKNVAANPSNIHLNYVPYGGPGPSGLSLRNLINRQNVLAQPLPQPNQIWLQPCNILPRSPPPPELPPRPRNFPTTSLSRQKNGNHFPSRSPPPIPTRSPFSKGVASCSSSESPQEKWICSQCTYNNNENLNICEVCQCNRLPPSLGKIISKANELNSLLTITNNNSSPRKSPTNRKSDNHKKWSKRK